MTAILGVVGDDGRAYVGADSGAVCGWEVEVLRDPKVFKRGGLVLGCTTSFRFRDLLRYGLAVPRVRGPVERWVRAEFVGAVRECLRAGGWMARKDEREEGGTVVLGVPMTGGRADRLFVVAEDLCVVEPRSRVASAGGAGSHAAVAARALLDFGHAPGPELIKRALAATQAGVGYVRPPFTVRSAG